MKKIILALVAVLSINAFPEIEFHCYENGDEQEDCTSRKKVNLSGFDSNITDEFNSNWYYTHTSSDNPSKYAFVFYDDEIWDDKQEKFSVFSAIDNGAFGDSVSMSEGAAYYQHVDANFSDCNTSCELSAKLDFTIYAFVGDTKLNLKKISDGFTVSKEGPNLSTIRFGSNTQSCDLTQTGEQLEDGSYQFSLNFSTCPVSVTAVDPNTNTSYQYTSDFNSLTKTFVSDDEIPSNNEGEVERELFNANGTQIGYLIFDFFTMNFRVVDLNRDPFSSDG